MLAMTPSSEPEMATAGLMIAFFPAHFFALPLRCCLSECSRDRLLFPLTFCVAFAMLPFRVLARSPFFR